jgi:hypothetical protein
MSTNRLQDDPQPEGNQAGRPYIVPGAVFEDVEFSEEEKSPEDDKKQPGARTAESAPEEHRNSDQDENRGPPGRKQIPEIVKAEALEKNQDPDEDEDQAPKDPVGGVVAVFGHNSLLFSNRRIEIYISHLKMKYELRSQGVTNVSERVHSSGAGFCGDVTVIDIAIRQAIY